MKSYAILLFLLVFVFLSGCTLLGQQQPTDQQKGQAIGVIIKSFKPGESKIYAGQSVTFYLTVENVGEEDAEEVKAVLTGLGTDWSGELNYQKEIGFLPKRLPNSPGGLSYLEWEVTSPEDKDIPNCPATVKVFYKYASTANGRIKVMSQEYKRTHPQETKGIEGFIASQAPIQISVETVQPFTYIKPGQIGTIPLTFKNVGQGSPYINKMDDKKVVIEKITIDGNECINHNFPKEVRIDPTSGCSITCQFYVPEVTDYTTLPLEVKLSYYYYVEATTSVSVSRLL
ncbi:MAG: hypothetical protein QXD95_07060 [Nitrososphaeria archaeon]